MQYTLQHRYKSGPSQVTIEMIAAGSRTVLSVEDNVGGGNNAEERIHKSKKGWDKTLQGLKQLVEAEQH